MKINVEIDLTTDEAKELFVPSEKQAEFGTELYNKWLNAVQKCTMELANPMRYVSSAKENRDE